MTVLRTRFAPSPTGALHLGNARTALHAALLARSTGGVFVLRSEDTDAVRSSLAHEQALIDDLHWLGLTWDEGPDCGGSHAPYRQSERSAIYSGWYERLESEGLAYPCFCTEDDLKRRRVTQRAAGKPPRYPGTCTRLSKTEVETRRAQQPSTLRLRVPPGPPLTFLDLVRGPQRFEREDLGDFVIRRSDGNPAFLFANAVDDALMAITHVLRGVDHLSNTPRQILILQLLGLPLPQYGHLSLIVGNDGTPLSKRHGARSLRELREAGYFPEAVCNHLARLGHPYETARQLGLDQLAVLFTVDRLGSAPAQYDEQALRHWQHEAVVEASVKRVWDWLPATVREQVPVSDPTAFIGAIRSNLLFPEEALHWATVVYGEDVPHNHDAAAACAAAGPAFFEAARQALIFHGETFQTFITALKQATGTRGPNLFHPLRAALTGRLAGPELTQLWKLIATEQIRKRLESLPRPVIGP